MSNLELFEDANDTEIQGENLPSQSTTPPPQNPKKKDDLISFSAKEPKSDEDDDKEIIDFKGSDVQEPTETKNAEKEEGKEEEKEDENESYNEDQELYHTPEPQNFKPKLYTFKFPLKVQPKQTYTVLAPPFWVLVDHLLAVVWHLYSGENTEKVGIVHLQWALEFSRWIKDEHGTIPTAVRSLLLVIEDALMEKYTNLSKIKPSKTETVGPSVSEKEDKFDTSVTLNDILSRTPGISSEKAMKKNGKKTVMSKASGPANQQPEKSKGEPAPSSDKTSLIKVLNHLKKYQEEKVKGETTFLSELEKAIEDFNNNEGDINTFLKKIEEKSSEN